MDLFRRIVLAALCAGTLSGFVITMAHQVGTVPIILEAEVFERAAEQSMDLASPADPAASVHHGEAAAWEPADGLERTVYTGLADVLTGIGFALLLVSAYSMTGTGVGWGRGLLWGLAGFAVFTLAPGLGLSPELPGTEAAPLLDRQIWWSATALLTVGGLALLMFRRQALWAIVAVVLIALPHVTGAPWLAEHASAVPESLANRFVLASTVTSLLFWVCLGITTGYLFQRFSRLRGRPEPA